MGSWFVFASMGIFPNAGQDIYFLTAPIFNRSTIRLGNGRTFTVEADQVGDSFLYIASATLNGKPYDRSWIRHAQMAQGGTLSLRLTDKPTGGDTSDVPPSVSTVGFSGK